ncbi:hypothetical protein KJ656_16505 [bacterium]|nr:hypothetical protein [bacterium]
MSDGGFDVDKHLKKRRGSIKLRPPVFNNRTGNLVSYPDISVGGGISNFNKTSSKQDKISRDLISRAIKNNSLTKDNISDKPTLDQDKLSSRSFTKPPSFKKNFSFSERVKMGWTKGQIMKYYSMSEKEYEKVIINLKNIKKSQ